VPPPSSQSRHFAWNETKVSRPGAKGRTLEVVERFWAPAWVNRAAYYLGEINAIQGRAQWEFIREVALSRVFVKSKLVRMASPTRPDTEPTEDLKRELDEHVRDDEANPDERVPAEGFIADLRKKFKPIIPK
jgi:hypothetical protein